MHAFVQPSVAPYQPPPALIERVVQTEINDPDVIPIRNSVRTTPLVAATGCRIRTSRAGYRLRIADGAWIITRGMPATVLHHHRTMPHIQALYVELADKAGAHFHVAPALILAVIAQESHFNPRAESAAGAEGLMQLMPSTARYMGVSNPFDPRQSIWGGTRYLALLIRHYQGNVRLALAAYNAGMTVVDAHGGRIPAYAETRAYVPEVVGNYLAIINSSGAMDGS